MLSTEQEEEEPTACISAEEGGRGLPLTSPEEAFRDEQGCTADIGGILD